MPPQMPDMPDFATKCAITKIQNKKVLEVCCIFLKSKVYDNSKKYFSKILGLGLSPLEHHIFLKKHPREKCRPPLFFNFNGGLLSSIVSKNHSNLKFSSKTSKKS